MFRLLELSGFVLVYLALSVHCAIVERSTNQCTPRIADEYCKMHIQSSRNPHAKCERGAIVCYMTSPRCRNAADCEDACHPLRYEGIFVQPQCVSSQCRCEVSDQCTQSNCQQRCVMRSGGKRVESSKCLPNNECLCKYVEQCTQSNCQQRCVMQSGGQLVASSKCLPNNECLCKYVEPCIGDGDCRSVCAKQYPGKKFISTQCWSHTKCLCKYVVGGSGTAIRPYMPTMALSLLTSLAMFPAPTEGKLRALLIPFTTFVVSISQLASG